jgi:hypothetical protein
MSDNGLGYPISFGKTANLVVEGKKTSIRKRWSKRYAQYFIKRYEQGIPVAAFDKDKKSGGSQLGWLKLTEKPYSQLLLEMPPKDVIAEGFPKYTKEQFIDKFFDGDALQEVWVVKFAFEPLKNLDKSYGAIVKADERSISVNSINSLDIEVIEELTEEEQQDRLHLERQIERAFYIAGVALAQLKARRLYKSTHKTFEDYCKERFGFTRDSAYLKIGAAEVYENIERILPTICRQNLPLPTNENQLRYLVKAKLEAPTQLEIWQKAVEVAGGKVPSGRIIKDIVQRIKEKTKLPLPYRVGEVCQLVARNNPELKGKGGRWCIVSELHEFSCTVNTWNSQYILKPEHLKSCNYSERECASMEELGVRMSLLYATGKLDEAAIWILNGLAKIERAYLNALEEKLLSLLETEYGTKGKNA